MRKQFNRRDFLQLSTGALGALVLSKLSCGERPGRLIDHIGLQLYSVRDVFEKNPAGTIREIAGMGYQQLESYERNEDMFWGLSNKGFKNLVDDLGLSLISSHCDPAKNFQRKVEQAAEIGMKYLVYNWPFSQVPMDEYKKNADLFNSYGEICMKAGLHFGYHNYSSSYQLLDGIYPQDLLMERTDPDLVHHQMDIYWVARAGQDPKHWLKKYPGKYKMSHVKDGDHKQTCELGRGTIDYRSILPLAIENGMEYFFVEQEDYPRVGVMKSAKNNAEWLKSV